MKKFYFLLCVVFVCGSFATSYRYDRHDYHMRRHDLKDDVQRVLLTKIGDNLYKDIISEAVIKTSLCVEGAVSRKALMKYGENSFDNKIKFKNGKTCQIVEITY
jgi:choline kinase